MVRRPWVSSEAGRRYFWARHTHIFRKICMNRMENVIPTQRSPFVASELVTAGSGPRPSSCIPMQLRLDARAPVSHDYPTPSKWPAIRVAHSVFNLMSDGDTPESEGCGDLRRISVLFPDVRFVRRA